MEPGWSIERRFSASTLSRIQGCRDLGPHLRGLCPGTSKALLPGDHCYRRRLRQVWEGRRGARHAIPDSMQRQNRCAAVHAQTRILNKQLHAQTVVYASVYIYIYIHMYRCKHAYMHVQLYKHVSLHVWAFTPV